MWTTCDIPAKLFFEALNEQDFTLLGEGTPEEQEKAFDSIFDEYVTLDNNEKVLSWYKKRSKIALINLQIQIISTTIYSICYVPLTNTEREALIDVLNNIEGVKVGFNKEKPLLEEVARIQTQVIGALKNRLNIEMSTEKRQEKANKFCFEQDLVSVQNVLGYNLNDDLSLRKYVFLKKSAENKANAQKKVKKNGK